MEVKPKRPCLSNFGILESFLMIKFKKESRFLIGIMIFLRFRSQTQDLLHKIAGFLFLLLMPITPSYAVSRWIVNGRA